MARRNALWKKMFSKFIGVVYLSFNDPVPIMPVFIDAKNISIRDGKINRSEQNMLYKISN